MRLVGYLRVTTDRQAEEGLGLEVQEEAVRQWAQAHGHELVALTRDEGQSGSNGRDTRLGLGDALEALREGGAEGLVVLYRLDRLARDLIVQETLLGDVWRMGREVFSTSAAEQGYLQDDPHDPSRKLIRQVLGAVNEYERSMISLRLRAGRLRKAQNGLSGREGQVRLPGRRRHCGPR
jgi:DNA invertase Pin-like site-specific DNA recombinase